MLPTPQQYSAIVESRVAVEKRGGDAAKLTAKDYQETKGQIRGLGQIAAHWRLQVQAERREQAVKDKKLLEDTIAAWELAGKPGALVQRAVGGLVGLGEVKV